MQPSQRRKLNELLEALAKLIVYSTVPNEVKGKARSIIDYYLANPFTKKQPDFFNQLTVAYPMSHPHAADTKYVPFLSMLLYSNHELLLARLEYLDMIDGLGFKPETIPTKEQMKNRFVEALAHYTEIDHTDFEALTTFLPLHAFGGVTPTTGGLKDLGTV